MWLCADHGPVQPHHNGLVEVCPHCAALLSVTVAHRNDSYVHAAPARPRACAIGHPYTVKSLPYPRAHRDTCMRDGAPPLLPPE